MSEIVVSQPTESFTPAAQLADCSPADQIELRYMNATNALLADAAENDAPQILVDVLTWALARVIDVCGRPVVAGDVLQRLGTHICTLAMHRRAREEAAQAMEEGHAPH